MADTEECMLEGCKYLPHIIYDIIYILYIQISIASGQGRLCWISRCHVISFMVSEPSQYMSHICGIADLSNYA